MSRFVVVGGLVLAAVAAATAVVALLLRSGPWLTLTAPVVTYVGIAVAIAGIALAGGALLRGRARRHIDDAAEAAREQERDARRRFLRRLDHEVKNPVTAIRTALAVPSPSPQAVSVASAQAARLSALVQDLGRLADLETRELERLPVSIDDLANEAIDAARAVTPDRDYRIELQTVPWPLPPVAGDFDLLLVALFNVVSNAAKYSDPGARIEVRASETGGWVTLEVSDTGWGIAAEDGAAIWDELARGSGKARGVEGSGLGLSIVRVVIERHGGTVGVRSQPGVGTRIMLRLPAVPGART